MTQTRPSNPAFEAALLQAFQLWQQGQQQPAIQAIRSFADEGVPPAVATIAWFLHQTGEPGWREAIPYVERAVRLGYPQTANYVIGQMMNDSDLRGRAIKILEMAMPIGLQSDPIGWAINAAQYGDAVGATEAMSVRAGPFPLAPTEWSLLEESAREAERRIRESESAATAAREQAQSTAAIIDREVSEVTERIRTQTGALFSLIEAATNRQAEAVFEEEATSLKAEERVLWRAGVAVVSAASIVALVPLVLHYVGIGPGFSSANVLAAHFTAAAALGVVSGVLFSRARGRDRARQRARDLTLALSTMFAYAGQIDDQGERARFTYEMGRVVIESFLRADAPASSDDSNSLLSALVSRTGS